ncbi:MAG: TolC family protein [Planctomycetota bacterium]
MTGKLSILAGVLYLLGVGCAVHPTAAGRRHAGVQEFPRADADLPRLTEESTLRDYEQYAAINSPAVRSAFHRWQAARQRVPQAGALPEPKLSLRYYYQEVETRVGPQKYAGGLSQMFPWFGTLDLRAGAAADVARAEQQRFHAAELDVAARVREAYAEYYYLSRAIAVVRENRALLEQIERVARARYRSAGAANRNVIRAQVELGKLEDRLQALLDLRGASAARLNAALGRPAETATPWPEGLPAPELNADDEQVLDLLAETNPDLAALEHEAERHEKRIELARKMYYPDFTVGGTYIETLGGKDPIIANVGLTLPIWFGKYRAAEREARHALRATRKKRADRVNRLSARAKKALYDFRDAQRKVKLYRDTLIPKAKQALKTTQTDYAGGKASFNDILDAERVLLDFQLSYHRALADRVATHAKLEELVGRSLGGTEE